MKKIYTALAGMAALAAPGHSQAIGERDAPPAGKVDGLYLYQSMRVINDFFSKEKHPECYNVFLFEEKGRVHILFSPKQSNWVHIEGEPEKKRPPVCGRNIGYVIDKTGKVIDHFYSR